MMALRRFVVIFFVLQGLMAGVGAIIMDGISTGEWIQIAISILVILWSVFWTFHRWLKERSYFEIEISNSPKESGPPKSLFPRKTKPLYHKIIETGPQIYLRIKPKGPTSLKWCEIRFMESTFSIGTTYIGNPPLENARTEDISVSEIYYLDGNYKPIIGNARIPFEPLDTGGMKIHFNDPIDIGKRTTPFFVIMAKIQKKDWRGFVKLTANNPKNNSVPALAPIIFNPPPTPETGLWARAFAPSSPPGTPFLR